jgi:hypothetical protein
MAGIVNKLKKLRGRSFDELRVRAAQKLAARAERAGVSRASRMPSDERLFVLLDAKQTNGARSPESLLEHFRTRSRPHFFAGVNNSERTRAELLRRFGSHINDLEEKARRIVAGRFDLLGLTDLSFGDPVDWHLEPMSGRRAPLVHWSEIDYLNADVAGDKKIIWELNRHAYFSTLGRAYLVTNDEMFAQTFAAHLESWMDANPPKIGINWASSLEVSFRLIAWLWAIHFFKNSPHLSPSLFARLWKFIYIHARHLETYLSTYFSPNTHLTGEALGLFYVGTLLPEFRRAERWREKGAEILLRALGRHVRPDGTYFEQTSYYHRYTTDFYTHFLLLARANNHPLPSTVEEKLKLLLDHLMFITRPDGTTPFYGDDDGGRLVMLDERRANDFRAALSTGATLFSRADYKWVAGEAAEETLWLVGAEGLDVFDKVEAAPPTETSRAFFDGGYYVMRDGWTAQSNYMLIDSGRHGADNCGHAHADALAFDLAARGRTVLVDPGTFTYTRSIGERNEFRRTEAHNTLTVDGKSSSEPDGFFTWKRIAEIRAREFIAEQRFDFFAGEHNGYAPAVHQRSVLFLKNDYWIVRDSVITHDRHRYDLNFHFATDVKAMPDGDQSLSVCTDEQNGAIDFQLFTFSNGAQLSARQNSISTCYAKREPATAFAFTKHGEGSQEFITFMIPHPVGERDEIYSVREMESSDGCEAFEVTGANDARDLILIGAGAVTGGKIRLSSDGEICWSRFVNHELKEFVLIGGSYIQLGEREIFRARERVRFRHETAKIKIENLILA